MWAYLVIFVFGVIIGLWWSERPIKQVLLISSNQNSYLPFDYGMSWVEFSARLDPDRLYVILDPSNQSSNFDVGLTASSFDWFAERLSRGHVLILEKMN